MKKTKRKASQRNFDFVNLGAIFILAVSFIIVLIIIINDINRVRENFTAFSPKTAALRLILPDDQMPKAQVPILMYHHIANNPKPKSAKVVGSGTTLPEIWNINGRGIVASAVETQVAPWSLLNAKYPGSCQVK